MFNKKKLEFKLDTRTEVTVISVLYFSSVKLAKSTKALFGPTKQPLNVIGQFTEQCSTCANYTCL